MAAFDRNNEPASIYKPRTRMYVGGPKGKNSVDEKMKAEQSELQHRTRR
jgi:hypothetical protein